MKAFFAAAVAWLMISTSTAWAADIRGAEEQMAGLKKRIENGKRDRSLTGEEASRLDAEYEAVARLIADAKRNGKVTREELKTIEDRQEALGRMIYRQKHDAEGRQAQPHR